MYDFLWSVRFGRCLMFRVDRKYSKYCVGPIRSQRNDKKKNGYIHLLSLCARIALYIEKKHVNNIIIQQIISSPKDFSVKVHSNPHTPPKLYIGTEIVVSVRKLIMHVKCLQHTNDVRNLNVGEWKIKFNEKFFQFFTCTGIFERLNFKIWCKLIF